MLSQMCASGQCAGVLGDPKDGPLRVDEEPMDCRRKGLDYPGLQVVGALGLSTCFVQGEPHILLGVLLDLRPCSLWDVGHVAAQDGLKMGDIHEASAFQVFSDGADRPHHVVGIC